MKATALTIAALVFLTATASAERIYEFVDLQLENGYGYSGTITTDGRYGDFTERFSYSTGQATSGPSPFVAWNITMQTPSAGDGVANEVFTERIALWYPAIASRERFG